MTICEFVREQLSLGVQTHCPQAKLCAVVAVAGPQFFATASACPLQLATCSCVWMAIRVARTPLCALVVARALCALTRARARSTPTPHQQVGSCMFVSGVPGTGKTASIRAVAKTLTAELEARQLIDFRFVEINGMALTTPPHLYTELWQAVRETKVNGVACARRCGVCCIFAGLAGLWSSCPSPPAPRRWKILLRVHCCYCPGHHPDTPRAMAHAGKESHPRARA